MRIVHLSDLHIGIHNLENLRNFYLGALITDLKKFNDLKSVDIIIISGDLVDKGGESLQDNCYDFVEKEFLLPIMQALKLSKDKILFIPGNHDINRNLIEHDNEYYLAEKLTKEEANRIGVFLREKFDRNNKRIEKFKNFERYFHKDHQEYQYSNFESLAIQSEQGLKVGFALINDSWRCSQDLKKESHFIGYNQLFRSLKYFEENNTSVNIAVFHHPLESLNDSEAEEIKTILESKNFHFVFVGHTHKYKVGATITPLGGYIRINGRAAFNDTGEKESIFQPGYNILDIDLRQRTYTLYARKFIKSSGLRFDKDVDSLPDGSCTGEFIKSKSLYKLDETSNITLDDLPSCYSADVEKIVQLLIGRSLYPDPYIFVRELIQNSVDACNRIKEKNTYINPKIIVNINTKDNYLEVLDEGDGMTKRVIKEHFAIIGKSLSQEFNDSSGNFNLISRFGIGFISTFIVAQKVLIATKTESDGLINFEIDDVFKSFNYLPLAIFEEFEKLQSGTKIRVYLRREYAAINLLGVAKRYFRHLSNVEFLIDCNKHNIPESWNTENGIFDYNLKNSKYEVRLTISVTPRSLISSNSGFLLTASSHNIIPFRFPVHIGGEVNFEPKSIDFDLSRSNIIVNSKANEFKKDISNSVRYLFRKVLESNHKELLPIVMNYLQCYLVRYDIFQHQFQHTYSDFYTERELLDLVKEYLYFEFDNQIIPLSRIIRNLKENKKDTIYYISTGNVSDFHKIMIDLLKDNLNLIYTNIHYNLQFRDGHETFSLIEVFQKITQEEGLRMIDFARTKPSDFSDLHMDKSKLDLILFTTIVKIENSNGITIEIANFNKISKPVVSYSNHFFINYQHDAFQSILRNINVLSEDRLHLYMLGLLGIDVNANEF